MIVMIAEQFSSDPRDRERSDRQRSYGNQALVKYLFCKTEHNTQHEFLPKTKDFEVFME